MNGSDCPIQCGKPRLINIANSITETNNIGIEGIPAKDGSQYFHCEQPEEYAKVIRELYNGRVNTYTFDTEEELLEAIEKHKNKVITVKVVDK